MGRSWKGGRCVLFLHDRIWFIYNRKTNNWNTSKTKKDIYKFYLKDIPVFRKQFAIK